jgi:hypothetical protein
MQGMQSEEIYTAISDTIADIESRANTLSSILGRSDDPTRFSTLWGAVNVMALSLNQTDRHRASTVQTLISMGETMAKAVINVGVASKNAMAASTKATQWKKSMQGSAGTFWPEVCQISRNTVSVPRNRCRF